MDSRSPRSRVTLIRAAAAVVVVVMVVLGAVLKGEGLCAEDCKERQGLLIIDSPPSIRL